MAVGTCTECGKEKELKNRTICEACRKRLQRQNKKGMVADLHTVVLDENDIVDTELTHPDTLQAIGAETPEQWLERRIKETGSTGMKSPNAKPGWQWIKTGTPPGSQPDIKVPLKWTLSDIDQAMSLRGQWGKREKS